MPDETRNTASNGQSSGGETKNAATKDATKNDQQKNHAATDPAPFDWVSQRSSCSLPKIFGLLRAEIEQDINTRNSLRPNYSPYEFSLSEDTEKFAVRLKAKDLQRSVIFTLADHAIVVRDDQGAQMFEVTLTFDDTGRCRLHVNAQERELWQVRRLALEDLMFRGL